MILKPMFFLMNELKGGEKMKMEWKKPVVEDLSVSMTMGANTQSGGGGGNKGDDS